MIIGYATGVRRSRRTFVGIGGVVVLMFAGLGFFAYAVYPSLSARLQTWWLKWEGRRRADDDWAHGRATVFAEPRFGGVWDNCYSDSEVFWDPATRLCSSRPTFFGWEGFYSARVTELLRERGTPAWACPAYPPVEIPGFFRRRERICVPVCSLV